MPSPTRCGSAIRILILGDDGPRLAWVQSMLELLRGRRAATAAPLQLVVVKAPATRDLLQRLAAEATDALVLVDHAPFAGRALPADLPSGMPPAELLRAEAQRAVLGLELARHAVQTVALGASDAWPATLIELLGLPLPDELPGVTPGPVPAPPANTVGTAGEHGLRLLDTYLAPLFATAVEPGPLALAWPRECFLDGDSPGKVLPPVAEVAGRARILAYGPYLPLPVGNWRAKAFLGFSPDIGKMPFILEADTGGAVSRGFFEVDRGGIFTLDLDFGVADAMHPIEMRLISQDSGIEGQVALIEVALEQVRTPPLPAASGGESGA